ncbi:MAG: Hsp20/alpha crystallin family protein [Nitrospinota bacterium]
MAYKETESERKTGIAPRADIFEQADGLTIFADMPGVDENSVDVRLDDDLVRISGEAAKQSPGEGHTLVYSEYQPGGHERYTRSFILSDDIDRDGISASIKNGMLKLTLPKIKKPGPRKIEIAS